MLASHFADYSLELALELARDHAVLLLIDGRQLANECAPERILHAKASLAVQVFGGPKHSAEPWDAAWAGARLGLFRPHALIAHEHGRFQVTALQRLGASLGRTLLIVHDPRPHAGRDTLIAKRHAREIAAQRRNAHTLFSHGAVCAADLAKVAQAQAPIVAIPHGPILRPPAPTSPSGAGRLLMFGRMEAYKGLDVLLEACRRLTERDACPPLQLIGDGPDLARLRADFERLPNVALSEGYAPRADILAALSAADGVVLPYTEATQSGVAAAAFANGRAVLASAVGGLSEVVRDGVNGRLVTPNDPTALAQALHRFSREAASFSAGALETAEGPLAWKHAAAALVEAARA